MSLVLKSKVKIGKATFIGVNDITIEKSIHSISQKCVIKLPLSAVLKNTEGISVPVKIADYISKGDEVTVTLWYDGYKEQKEFFGFVKTIDLKQPLEIECENAIWLLRGKTFKQSFKTVKLKDLLQFITAGTGIELHKNITSGNYQLEIKNFQIADKDAVWVLEELRDKYMQTIYFTNDKELYVGLAYTEKAGMVKYDMAKNIINPSSLKFQDAKDVKIQMRVVYWDKKGKKHEVSYGEEKRGKELSGEAEVRAIHLYDVQDESQLKKLAEAELAKYKYSGYKGDFDTFLIPFCEPMMTAKIENKQYPERSGTYYISGVKITYGTGGARRKPTIDIKLN